MTADQLTKLAEHAAYAADFYTHTNPVTARTFAETALLAHRLSAQLQRDQELARIGAELATIKTRLGATT